MSLLPVAEALQALERDGLVESRPRVGTRVCLPCASEIRDRYQVREALESQAARLYAERAGLRERRTMESMAAHMADVQPRPPPPIMIASSSTPSTVTISDFISRSPNTPAIPCCTP